MPADTPPDTTAPPPAPPPPAGGATRLRCLWWTAALACGFLVLLVLVLVTPGRPPLLPLDGRTDAALHGFARAHPSVTRLNLVLTDWVWGPTTMRLLTVAAAALLLGRGHRRRATWTLIACAAGWALETGAKAAVGRARPHWPHPVDSATAASFPSGHAVAAATACVTLLWLMRLYGVRGQWWTAAVAIGAVSATGVGFTRLYLGVHWPSDVLAGWLLGAAVVTASAAVIEPWKAVEQDLSQRAGSRA
ncbi:phosphatase PAP2 family protein [Streptomyces sp. RB6PN25]|uniref:Phosphatase PAP2 family protein n=1 Tax=Streptomyces humicola TaxID=2953240 RepID=A0ABT1Q205_9ACTN|nr:phosphatase PAP2 family protein [Streptomyces humicola]MCQ4083335.1 phosphatase PAP2 family protein [Streptomyces humicola]